MGDAIPFCRDTLAFERKYYEEFGPVFTTRMGPESQLFLRHTDAAKVAPNSTHIVSLVVFIA